MLGAGGGGLETLSQPPAGTEDGEHETILKKGTAHHPKTHALADKLGVPLPMAVGILHMLWEYTADNCPRGDVGSIPDGAIAAAVGWSRKKPALLIDALCECGWLDRHEKYRLVIHDWGMHSEYDVCRKLIRTSRDFLEVYGISARDRVRDEKVRPNGARKLPVCAPVGPIYAPTRGAIGIGSGSSSSLEGGLGGFDCKALADELWEIHPSPSMSADVEKALSKEKYNSVNPDGFDASVAASLRAWVDYWTTENRYATGLVKWIESGDYARKPPALRPAPKSKLERMVDSI